MPRWTCWCAGWATPGTSPPSRGCVRGAPSTAAGLDRFAPQGRYDVIVSLDGPSVLMSPDSPGIGHAALVRLLGTWLGTDGTLVATVSNELSASTRSSG